MTKERALEYVRPTLTKRAKALRPRDWEELLQETMVKMCLKYDQAKDHSPASLIRWGYMIMRNTHTDWGRKRRVLRFADAVIDGASGPEALDPADEIFPNHRDDMSQVELHETLRWALRRIPRNHAEALIAVSEEGCQKDAMERLGLTEPALKSRFYRGRRAIKEILKGVVAA